MVKKLVKHGNSFALVIDKPILDLLKITEDTDLEIETLDGKSLQIKPMKGAPQPRRSIKESLERINKKHGKTLRNLAK